MSIHQKVATETLVQETYDESILLAKELSILLDGKSTHLALAALVQLQARCLSQLLKTSPEAVAAYCVCLHSLAQRAESLVNG